MIKRKEQKNKSIIFNNDNIRRIFLYPQNY